MCEGVDDVVFFSFLKNTSNHSLDLDPLPIDFVSVKRL